MAVKAGTFRTIQLLLWQVSEPLFTVTTHSVLRLDYLRIQHIEEKALDRTFNVDGATAGVAYVF